MSWKLLDPIADAIHVDRGMLIPTTLCTRTVLAMSNTLLSFLPTVSLLQANATSNAKVPLWKATKDGLYKIAISSLQYSYGYRLVLLTQGRGG